MPCCAPPTWNSPWPARPGHAGNAVRHRPARVELVGVRALDVSLNEGVVRVVLGKGGKDRLVPLGAEAAHWIDQYLARAVPSWPPGASATRSSSPAVARP